MRRLILALLIGLSAATSHAGDMYYRTILSFDIKAISDKGGSPRVVLRSTEYAYGYLSGMTRFNHLGSNGQALLQSYPLTSTNAPMDLQLIYRAANGVVVTKHVTSLAGNQPRPIAQHARAQDDSFFSFAARDDATGRSSIWRLNVTVDQALAPGYIPPSSYNDSRLVQVLDQADISSHQTWSPDGSKMAYLTSMTQPDGTRKAFARLKSLADGSDVILGAWIGEIFDGFTWSPTDNRIVAANGTGDVWAYHADTPGLTSWVAQSRTYKSGKDTITEQARWPRFRPDGGVIGISYYKSVSNKSGNPVYGFPAVMTANGWPATPLTNLSTYPNDNVPLGWTP